MRNIPFNEFFDFLIKSDCKYTIIKRRYPPRITINIPENEISAISSLPNGKELLTFIGISSVMSDITISNLIRYGGDYYLSELFYDRYLPLSLKAAVECGKFNLKTRNKNGMTIFHSKFAYVYVYIPHDINVIDYQGNTIIHTIHADYFRYNCQKVIMAITDLFKLGFNTNACNKNGDTIFHTMAVHYEQKETLTDLLTLASRFYNFKTFIKNNKGETVHSYNTFGHSRSVVDNFYYDENEFK